VTVEGDTERFLSPSAFLIGVSPEALANFTSLEVLVEGNGLALRVSFERRDRGRLGGGGTQVVALEVSPNDVSGGADALDVARAVAMTIRRGYARWWAGCESALAVRGEAGRPLRGRAALTVCVYGLVGVLLGYGLGRLFDDIPGIVLSEQAMFALLLAAGMAYPTLIPRLIPNVEVAPEGRTRLISVAYKTSLALAGLAATQVLQLILE